MADVQAWLLLGSNILDLKVYDAVEDADTFPPTPIPADGVWLAATSKAGTVVSSASQFYDLRLVDALKRAAYLPWRGALVCRVEVRDGVDTPPAYSDRAVERRILWRVDADALLNQFARGWAMEVASLWAMPAVVSDYLTGGDPADAPAAAAAARAAFDAALSPELDAAGPPAEEFARANTRAGAVAAALAAGGPRMWARNLNHWTPAADQGSWIGAHAAMESSARFSPDPNYAVADAELTAAVEALNV